MRGRLFYIHLCLGLTLVDLAGLRRPCRSHRRTETHTLRAHTRILIIGCSDGHPVLLNEVLMQVDSLVYYSSGMLFPV